MSGRVTALVWARARAKGTALLALLALADLADDAGHAAIQGGLAGLARRIRMSERNTRLVVRDLERAGDVRVRYGAGPRGAHHFDLLVGAWAGGDGEGVLDGGKDGRAGARAGARIAEVGAEYLAGSGGTPDRFAGVVAEEFAGHGDSPDTIAGGEDGRAARIAGVGAARIAGVGGAGPLVVPRSTPGDSGRGGQVDPAKIAGVVGGGPEVGRRRDPPRDGSDAEGERSGDPDHSSSGLTPGRRARRVFADDEPALALAVRLRARILANLPGARVPETPGKLQAWAGVMDLLLRVDRRAPEEVAGLIDWCEADAFWRTVILSPGALREKWERLVLQRQRQEGQHATGGRGGPWGGGRWRDKGARPEPGSDEYYAARRPAGDTRD